VPDSDRPTPQQRSLQEKIADLIGPEGVAPGRPGRNLALAAVAGGVVLLGLWWVFWGRGESAPVYVTELAEVDGLVVTASATGTLQPTNEVEVGSELSGILDLVTVDYNDRVTKGQLLARLDVSKLTAEMLQSAAALEAAQAALEERKATVVEAEAEVARLRAVRVASGGRVPSAQDMDAAEATAARARAASQSAEAQIALARAKLDFDRTNLAKAEIRAPIDGIVLRRNVEAGQTIAASLQTPVLFTLAEDLTKMDLEVDVDEADVGQVREGQRATFTVDAYPDREFPAHITQLRYASETIEGVVSYKAILVVENSDLALRPGMTATAEIVVAEIEDALLIPNAALRFVPPQKETDERGLLQKLVPFGPRRTARRRDAEPGVARRTVYRLVGGKPEQIEIEVGATDGQRTQVLAGDVAAGTAVIVDTASGGR
jgi:HlyD family secretion protein